MPRFSRLVLALVVAVLAFSTASGNAQTTGSNGRMIFHYGNHADVVTTDYTKYDAWVDISWAYKLQGWRIEKAFCIHPKETYKYRVIYNHPSLGPQVRVRAYIKLAGCRAGTHTMVQGSGNVYKNQETFIVGIHEPSGNHFFMSFPGTL